MKRRIVQLGLALIFGALLLALTTTTLSYQASPSCPAQEQTPAGSCAGPTTSGGDTSNPTRAVIELRPAP